MGKSRGGHGSKKSPLDRKKSTLAYKAQSAAGESSLEGSTTETDEDDDEPPIGDDDDDDDDEPDVPALSCSGSQRWPKKDHRKAGPSTYSVDNDSSDDDEAYKAVDDISDSDGGEMDMEQLEEQAIIAEGSFVKDAGLKASSGGSPSEFSEGWGTWEFNDEFFPPEAPFFEEEFARTDPLLLPSEAATWNGFSDTPLDTPAPRRVRFEDNVQLYSDSSNSDSSESAEPFPDLFLRQDGLDPLFRSMIENDQDADEGNSLTDGEWDVDADEEFGVPTDPQDDNESTTSEGSSSGYESMFCKVVIACLLLTNAGLQPILETPLMKTSHRRVQLRILSRTSVVKTLLLVCHGPMGRVLRHFEGRLPTLPGGSGHRWALGWQILPSRSRSSTPRGNG